jgi:hypothetical protein
MFFPRRKGFMKTKMISLALALAGGLTFGSFPAFANLEVSADISIHATTDFYQPLAPNGEWVTVGSYGRCWRPTHVVVGWRPYCAGHWEWTDCGWYWVSDEPWGWACYHYGTWVQDGNYGWVWIPGVEWSPAWVVWRTGGGYVGWSPCVPSGVVVVPGFFVFVEQGRFTERCSPNTVIVNNTTIINKTKTINITKSSQRKSITIEGQKRSVIYNEGPGVRPIEKAVNRKIAATSVRDAYQNDVREYHRTASSIRDNTNTRREERGLQMEQNQMERQQQQRQNYQQERNTFQQEQDRLRNEQSEERNRIEQQSRAAEQNRIQNERNRIEEQNRIQMEQRSMERDRLNQERNRLQEQQNQRREVPNRAIPPEQSNPQTVPPIRERQIPPGQMQRERQREVVPPNQPGQPVTPQQGNPNDQNDRDKNRGGPPA